MDYNVTSSEFSSTYGVKVNNVDGQTVDWDTMLTTNSTAPRAWDCDGADAGKKECWPDWLNIGVPIGCCIVFVIILAILYWQYKVPRSSKMKMTTPTSPTTHLDMEPLNPECLIRQETATTADNWSNGKLRKISESDTVCFSPNSNSTALYFK